MKKLMLILFSTTLTSLALPVPETMKPSKRNPRSILCTDIICAPTTTSAACLTMGGLTGNSIFCYAAATIGIMTPLICCWGGLHNCEASESNTKANDQQNTPPTRLSMSNH